MRGRKTKLTPEMHAEVIDLLRKGNFRSVVCRVVGIDVTTLRDWMRRGEAGEEPYAALYVDAIAAESLAETDLLQRITSHQDWKAAAWVLERRKGTRWLRRDPDEPKDRTHGTDILDALRELARTEPETVRRVLAEVEGDES